MSEFKFLSPAEIREKSARAAIDTVDDAKLTAIRATLEEMRTAKTWGPHPQCICNAGNTPKPTDHDTDCPCWRSGLFDGVERITVPN